MDLSSPCSFLGSLPSGQVQPIPTAFSVLVVISFHHFSHFIHFQFKWRETNFIEMNVRKLLTRLD